MKPAKLNDPEAAMPSPPTRGRGLKPGLHSREFKPRPVAPHAGAWIETR